MQLYYITNTKTKSSLDLSKIDVFGCVKIIDDKENTECYEIWFKTDGVENPWNCALVGTETDKLGNDKPTTRFHVPIDEIITAVNKIKNGELFLTKFNGYFKRDTDCKYIINKI